MSNEELKFQGFVKAFNHPMFYIRKSKQANWTYDMVYNSNYVISIHLFTISNVSIAVRNIHGVAIVKSKLMEVNFNMLFEIVKKIQSAVISRNGNEIKYILSQDFKTVVVNDPISSKMPEKLRMIYEYLRKRYCDIPLILKLYGKYWSVSEGKFIVDELHEDDVKPYYYCLLYKNGLYGHEIEAVKIKLKLGLHLTHLDEKILKEG